MAGDERPERTAARARQAASFDSAADVYERSRPGYPDPVVDWLLATRPRAVLDLGSGTGKLTRALVGRVERLTAVDPSPRMLEQLRAAVPGVPTAIGTAEAIPLPDASVDAVLVAQAWHWVDQDRAVPEVARVLRPGGVLGLVWNTRDESVGWVRRLSAILAPDAAGRRSPGEEHTVPTRLGPVVATTHRWSQPFDRAALHQLLLSRSYVITASDERRRELLAEVDLLLAEDEAFTGPPPWPMPYITSAWRITRV